MFTLRKSEERGHANHGWLNAKHTFSFANYFDPRFMGFRNLIVINQDQIAPATGFSTHPHKDMEIITYIIKGAIKHKDSMGNDYVIETGETQVMSAGTGIKHSEHNASNSELLELLQIWILTDKKDHTPSYNQKKYTREEKLNTLKLVAGSYESEADLKIHQDVKLFASVLEIQKSINYSLKPNRFGWVQLISGQLQINLKSKDNKIKETVLNPGDGIQINDNCGLTFTALSECEFMFFDLN